ncbi:MAG: hypothetical protein K8R99_10420 [Actinomycetia bacterium]|nr:hypothetical protein [Actinomycetes bacterium]
MKRRPLFAAALLLLASATSVGCAQADDKAGNVETAPLGANEQATYEYTVPFGTGRSIDSGEIIEIMPQTLQVKVGESIRITNKDIRGYDIGPFYVDALQTLAMRFTHTGRLSGICAVNPDGEFVIEVTD